MSRRVSPFVQRGRAVFLDRVLSFLQISMGNPGRVAATERRRDEIPGQTHLQEMPQLPPPPLPHGPPPHNSKYGYRVCGFMRRIWVSFLRRSERDTFSATLQLVVRRWFQRRRTRRPVATIRRTPPRSVPHTTHKFRLSRWWYERRITPLVAPATTPPPPARRRGPGSRACNVLAFSSACWTRTASGLGLLLRTAKHQRIRRLARWSARPRDTLTQAGATRVGPTRRPAR